MHKSKGDLYNGLRVTCAACGTTSTSPGMLADHACPSCARVLNGAGRRDELDLS